MDLLTASGDPLDQRIAAKVAYGDTTPTHLPSLGPCLLWHGANSDGYGLIRVDGHLRHVHRLVFARHGMDIPEGFEVDHACHDWSACEPPCPHRACVELSHLRLLTRAENRLRSSSPPAVNARKTHCTRRRHRYTDDTVFHPPGEPDKTLCLACLAENRNKASDARLRRTPCDGQIELLSI